MIGYNESTGIYAKEWDTVQGILKLEANFKTGKMYVFLKNGTEISKIPLLSLTGIPKEAFNDVEKLAAFLNDSYAKLSLYDDGSYKIQISQKLLGGGNTINPNIELQRLWPGARVPYVINYDDDRAAIVERAIKAWNHANTGFVLTEAKKDKYGNILEEDYIIFDWDEKLSCSREEIESKKCSVCESYVGRKGGPQRINCNLSDDFNEGSVMHEIGHALGLYHEQQREDRDKSVTISNDGKSDTANYGKEGNNFGGYDFKSIMHYHFFEYPTKKVKEVDMTENEEFLIREVEIPDFEKPKMRINHSLPEEQHEQIVQLSSKPNFYGKKLVPNEELKEEHRHLIAGNPNPQYDFWSGVLSVGDQQRISEGDKAAAKYLADHGKKATQPLSQQPTVNVGSSYRRGRGY